MNVKELNLNGVLAAVVVVGAAYIVYKVFGIGRAATNAITGAVNAVAGTIAQSIDASQSKEILTQARVALASKGQDLNDFLFYVPKPSEKLPAGSWVVTYNKKQYYFVPKTAFKGMGYMPYTL